MTDWDLEKYYWPKARVERWWKQGWDWDSLLIKPCPHPDFDTYADYYGEAFSRTVLFDDPRPDKTGQISEWEYWHDPQKGDRWLTEFAGKKWTPYHLPLYDLDGNLSPKHMMYYNAGLWTKSDEAAFKAGLIERMALGEDILLGIPNRIRNAPLNGIVVPSLMSLTTENGTPLYTQFRDALFGHNVNLACINFEKYLDIDGASFASCADFSHTNFGFDTSFGDVWFGDHTNFQGAIFQGRHITEPVLSLSQAQFGIGTNFAHAKFCSAVSFATRNNSVFERISFASTTFCASTDFSGLCFIGKTDFQKAIFKGVAKFYDAGLPEETYFTFKDKNWPLPKEPNASVSNDVDNVHPNNTKEQEIEYEDFKEYEKAFCRLKKIQQGHEARTAEHFFYKLELKARMRRSDIRWTEKFAAGAYGLFSDYGESIGRPLAWLLVSFLIATAVTCCAALPFWQDFAPDNLGFAATAAWHNLVPGGFIRDVFQGCHDEACRSYRYGEWSDHLLTRWGFSLYVVTGLFAAFNLALWFLFGLA
ncbi:MAG: hypothetical protein WCD42_11825, partial [Rhizomicrobium sp.]